MGTGRQPVVIIGAQLPTLCTTHLQSPTIHQSLIHQPRPAACAALCSKFPHSKEKKQTRTNR